MPFAAGQENPTRSGEGHWLSWAHFSFPFNLGRNPAISIPAGLSAQGLPVGVQIIGPLYADHAVLDLAARLESLLPALPVPALTPLLVLDRRTPAGMVDSLSHHATAHFSRPQHDFNN